MSRSPVLNRDQARHVAAILAVFAGDLETLRATVRAEPWGDAAVGAISAIEAEMGALQRDLGIANLARRSPPAQRLAAVCGVWRARLPELGTGTLKAYGAVHIDLADVLAPHIGRLLKQLERLAATPTAP